jgi:CRISPR/Cas system Type II protein with McrA/HNH and RuvC-like nuclease domain
LPDGYLQALYDEQNGRCFYTDKEFEITVGEGWNPRALSVDRVDPDRGYVVGNLVLCARRVNSIKQDMTIEELQEWVPSWYARIVAAANQGKIAA